MQRGLWCLILLAGCALSEPSGEAGPAPWVETEGLRLAGSGYRASDDPCRRAGETAVSVDFLDDAADLVACPVGDPAADSLMEQHGARRVGGTAGYDLYNIPRR